MQFLADVELVCEECKGTRFKSSILDIRYKGLNIHEVLQLTVKEALAFFSDTPRLVNKLKVLDEVGLGYLRLGQSATTLTGGEAQRVKLAAHLAQATCEGTLFIFDEPTTGLHFDDIAKLLDAFQRLIHNGGSILIIEHNLDVIRSADWVIDLGPEGGEGGGRIVAEGTPEQIAEAPDSYTGSYLAPILHAANIATLKSTSPRLSSFATSSSAWPTASPCPSRWRRVCPGAVSGTRIIVVAGLAEIAAGSIAMGLGGYLAAKSDADHYDSERRREEREVEEIPEEEAREVIEVFKGYGLTRSGSHAHRRFAAAAPQAVDRFHDALRAGPGRARPQTRPQQRPHHRRSLHRRRTDSAGALHPARRCALAPCSPPSGSRWSLWPSSEHVKATTRACPCVPSALRTAVIGGLAAAAAFGIARLVGQK